MNIEETLMDALRTRFKNNNLIEALRAEISKNAKRTIQEQYEETTIVKNDLTYHFYSVEVLSYTSSFDEITFDPTLTYVLRSHVDKKINKALKSIKSSGTINRWVMETKGEECKTLLGFQLRYELTIDKAIGKQIGLNLE
jgi:hypothetical protein